MTALTGPTGQSFVDRGYTYISNAQGAYIATVDESVPGSLSAAYDTTGQAVAGTGHRGSIRSRRIFFQQCQRRLAQRGCPLSGGRPRRRTAAASRCPCYSDDGGRPGQSLATLGVIDDKSLTNAATLVQLQAPSGLQLAAGTEYWIVASDSRHRAKLFGSYDSSDAGVGASGQSYDDRWQHPIRIRHGAYIADVEVYSPCYCAGTLHPHWRAANASVETLEIGDEVDDGFGRAAADQMDRAQELWRPLHHGPEGYPAGLHQGGRARTTTCRARDLWISPHHAMYLAMSGRVLIEAKDLVNGVSIVQARERRQGRVFPHRARQPRRDHRRRRVVGNLPRRRQPRHVPQRAGL